MIIKGLKINYKTLGEGNSLLILHGWGSRSDNWQRVGEMLAEKGIKVIIPDLPGFGQSQKPPRAWNLDDYCDFVEEFVKILNLANFSLLGHSFGGALAVKCGLKFPEKIDKLFLASAVCIRKKTFKNKLFKFLSKFLKIKTPFLRKVFYRKSDYLSVEGTMKEIYLKLIKQDLSDVLSQIQIPTVIIWGEKDNITPLSDAKIINQKIKDSKIEIIPNVGHDLNLKTPEKLAEVISKNL
ncbi:alpha/beta hydrolase [Patescibacteria group bacterium]|nr:alpha/beta hydrolase [Patescibacteria group bacterium]